MYKFRCFVVCICLWLSFASTIFSENSKFINDNFQVVNSTGASLGKFSEGDTRETFPPNDVTISSAGNTVILSWTAMPNASDYVVEVSATPLSGFENITSQGRFTYQANTVLWTKDTNDSHRFYRVRSRMYTIPHNFVLIQSSTFNNSVSEVSVSPFYMDKFEITQSAYAFIIGTNPSHFIGQPTLPVEIVSWFDAIEYCNRRSINEVKIPCYSYNGYGSDPYYWPADWKTYSTNHVNITCDWTATGYRLPTEAEWEFAARGGINTHDYPFSGSNTPYSVAWYSDTSSYETWMVGSILPNELGLFDMSGNVYEWCWDIYGNYPSKPQCNPQGSATGNERISRGGCWGSSAANCMVNARRHGLCSIADEGTGFRVCLNDPLAVRPPAFNLQSGVYARNLSVVITDYTIGSIIHYTLDNTNPTDLSPIYINPLLISENTILKARAYKTGMTTSAVTSAEYSIVDNFVLVNGGTFNNGSSNVTLSDFYIDKYEVTQAEYETIMGMNPSYFTGYGNSPVEQVSWFDAIEFCNRKSLAEGLTPCYCYTSYGAYPAEWPEGWKSVYTNQSNVYCDWSANGYRLPTEMEWQFAARGGNSTHGYTYSGGNVLASLAWCSSNAPYSTQPVGTLAANELGFFDMSGNVCEWVWDTYGTYPSSTQTNPHGQVSGLYKIQRGGSWGYYPDNCAVAFRVVNYSTDANEFVGIRLCRNVPNMILIPGGTFNNGASNVTISSFYMDRFEITQTSFLSVMKFNYSMFSSVDNGPDNNLTWFDAIEYCNRRSMIEGLIPCYSYSTYGTNPSYWPGGWSSESNQTNIVCNWTVNGYRLPTEAEWEFAARGGNSTHGYTYSGSNSYNTVAWSLYNSGDTTHTLGTLLANELGLFDMSGNVIEYCWDLYGTYPSTPQTNPHGPSSGTHRIIRGGSYSSEIAGINISNRFHVSPMIYDAEFGFRICRNSL